MWELVGSDRLEPFRTKCSPAGYPTLTLPKGREQGVRFGAKREGMQREAKGSKGQHDSEAFTRSHPLWESSSSSSSGMALLAP
jgi:hypothetical protein